MINSKYFTERLQKIINYYGLSASSFADKIGVQRSSISHILSGRNKPSLDFVMKILSSFPEVDLYWLLNGKGNFPNETTNQEHKSDIFREFLKRITPAQCGFGSVNFQPPTTIKCRHG